MSDKQTLADYEARAWIKHIVLEDDDGAPLPQRWQPAAMADEIEALYQALAKIPLVGGYWAIQDNGEKAWAGDCPTCSRVHPYGHADGCIWLRACRITGTNQ